MWIVLLFPGNECHCDEGEATLSFVRKAVSFFFSSSGFSKVLSFHGKSMAFLVRVLELKMPYQYFLTHGLLV